MTHVAAPAPPVVGAQIEVRGLNERFGTTDKVVRVNGVVRTFIFNQVSEPHTSTAQIEDGDVVEILQVRDDWVELRVAESVVAERVGKQGWVERWLVEGTPPPPQ